ncbi:uncharacterized protein LOC100373343 [Saccoglossus kowalevskii]|uniref:Nuclear receptor-binding factor 2-like n=1 Tax=Saccoglossus kowalevskii TaxID=10224 RepID=A0ABM0H1G0_SACKO|nr:PREDICTED: nuclear receptor-binding factor 2-like [Saccoglossus kowalevskii]
MTTEAPLNLAHQQDRKADRYVTVGRFQEAIACHERAAEYIKKAMKVTDVQQALTSLELQYTNHKKQHKVIMDKQRRHELMLKIKAMKLEEMKATPDGSRINFESGNEDAENTNILNGNSEPMIKYNRCNEETDSLLQFLNGHSTHNPHFEESTAFILAASTKEIPKQSLTRTAEVLPSDTIAVSTNGAKLPNDINDYVHELRMQNLEYRNHIIKLTRALESCEEENQELRESVQGLKRQMDELKSVGLTALHRDIISGLNTPFSHISTEVDATPPTAPPPLAPLEMPDFSFDIAKLGSSPPL